MAGVVLATPQDVTNIIQSKQRAGAPSWALPTPPATSAEAAVGFERQPVGELGILMSSPFGRSATRCRDLRAVVFDVLLCRV